MVISIVLGIGLITLICGLLSLFCWNGPYHPGYFTPGSAWASIFGKPNYNTDIRDYFELQRISRKSRLGNWNDTKAFRQPDNLVSLGFSWSNFWKPYRKPAPIKIEVQSLETDDE